MTELDPDSPDDPWMTVAEFAEAMRLQPVTVRSWIAKGQLTATRSGRRKWLIRRSELKRMLEHGGEPTSVPPPSPPRFEPLVPDDYPVELLEQGAKDFAEREHERLEQENVMAAYEWQIALEQSRMAPPDARFVRRIRDIAAAAAFRATVIRECMEGDPSFAWTPIPAAAGMTLSYELRPGGNRPGPKDAWDRFDRVVSRVGAAMEDTSASAVASTLSDLASAMNDLADSIENRASRSSEPDAGGISTAPEDVD